MVGRQQDGTSTRSRAAPIDDVQVYRRALTPAELESMFLSGRSGVCVPAPTALTVAPTVQDLYGSDATATLTARLTSGGVGVAGRTLAFSLSGTQVGTAVTDADGNASLTVNVANKNAGHVTAHHGDALSAMRRMRPAPATATLTSPNGRRPSSGRRRRRSRMARMLSPRMFNATTTETVSGSFAYYAEHHSHHAAERGDRDAERDVHAERHASTICRRPPR